VEERGNGCDGSGGGIGGKAGGESDCEEEGVAGGVCVPLPMRSCVFVECLGGRLEDFLTPDVLADAREDACTAFAEGASEPVEHEIGGLEGDSCTTSSAQRWAKKSGSASKSKVVILWVNSSNIATARDGRSVSTEVVEGVRVRT
jgi:hypothetical protein